MAILGQPEPGQAEFKHPTIHFLSPLKQPKGDQNASQYNPETSDTYKRYVKDRSKMSC